LAHKAREIRCQKIGAAVLARSVFILQTQRGHEGQGDSVQRAWEWANRRRCMTNERSRPGSTSGEACIRDEGKLIRRTCMMYTDRRRKSLAQVAKSVKSWIRWSSGRVSVRVAHWVSVRVAHQVSAWVTHRVSVRVARRVSGQVSTRVDCQVGKPG
jgi:hypothetical protein